GLATGFFYCDARERGGGGADVVIVLVAGCRRQQQCCRIGVLYIDAGIGSAAAAGLTHSAGVEDADSRLKFEFSLDAAILTVHAVEYQHFAVGNDRSLLRRTQPRG